MISNDVVLYPDPILQQKCEEVTSFNNNLKIIIDSMFKTMKSYGGVGLSAPQIGLKQRFFVIGLPEGDRVFINPVLSDLQGSEEMEEGCLSFPSVRVMCRRAKKCRINAFDVEGKSFEIEADGLLARAVLHEADHLLGKTLLLYMNGTDRIINKKALERLEGVENGKKRTKGKRKRGRGRASGMRMSQ